MRGNDLGQWLRRRGAGLAAFATATVFAGTAFAETYGRADPGQMGMQPAVTPVADEMHFFHNGILLPVITIITVTTAAAPAATTAAATHRLRAIALEA